jgi:hypothetical protein
MLHTTYAGPNGANVNDYYSAFPRMAGDTVTRIIGNDNVIPGVRPSYQFNTLATSSTFSVHPEPASPGVEKRWT